MSKLFFTGCCLTLVTCVVTVVGQECVEPFPFPAANDPLACCSLEDLDYCGDGQCCDVGWCQGTECCICQSCNDRTTCCPGEYPTSETCSLVDGEQACCTQENLCFGGDPDEGGAYCGSEIEEEYGYIPQCCTNSGLSWCALTDDGSSEVQEPGVCMPVPTCMWDFDICQEPTGTYVLPANISSLVPPNITAGVESVVGRDLLMTEGYVYRVLTEPEVQAWSVFAKDPNPALLYTPDWHISRGSSVSTQYISTSRDFDANWRYCLSKWPQRYVMVMIDVSIVVNTGCIALEAWNGEGLNPRSFSARNFASNDQEVLLCAGDGGSERRYSTCPNVAGAVVRWTTCDPHDLTVHVVNGMTPENRPSWISPLEIVSQTTTANVSNISGSAIPLTATAAVLSGIYGML